jgi:hypothetical protein
MSEKPILFSAPMVVAILEGRKTQTRRVLKNPEYYGCPTGDCPHHYQSECNAAMQVQALPDVRIKVGDTLWVREAWRTIGDAPLSECTGPEDISFYATANHVEVAICKWRPSIHMPRWASRISLKVNNVIIERLQDISEADAIAEGIKTDVWETVIPYLEDPEQAAAHDLGTRVFYDPSNDAPDCVKLSAKAAFEGLWTSINGQDSWDANPWVVAYTFERVKP